LAAAWLGSFLGDQCWFLLGRRYGGRMIKRFPKWEPGVEVALDFLHRYNAKFILSFRFIYGIRNVSSIACGMSKLTWGRFALLNFIAAGVWAAAFVTVGFVFGQLSEAVLGKASRLIGLSALASELPQLLADYQAMLFQRALDFRAANTHLADSYDEFKAILDKEGGFIMAHWCGSGDCEKQINAETGASLRVIPFEGSDEPGACLIDGGSSTKRVLFARAY